MTKLEEVRDYVIEWDSRFPIDRWWRKKYNIAFNSPRHRESSFLDQLIEFEEDKLFKELEEGETYVPNTGDFLRFNKGAPIDNQIKSLRDEFKDLEDD